jgi:hypothetical protein
LDPEQDKADALQKITVKEDAHAHMCLWATEISFPHPSTGKEVNVTMDDPEWLQALLKYQEEQHREQSKRCT